jgi:hypothetical protein
LANRLPGNSNADDTDDAGIRGLFLDSQWLRFYKAEKNDKMEA